MLAERRRSTSEAALIGDNDENEPSRHLPATHQSHLIISGACHFQSDYLMNWGLASFWPVTTARAQQSYCRCFSDGQFVYCRQLSFE